MNTKVLTGGALTGLVFAGVIGSMVSAQTVADATGLTEDQAIEIALMEVPGEVTEVEKERDDGEQVYEIEILGADGIETEIKIAAQTGEILEVEVEGSDCDKDDDDA
ncbi:MAG: PepSY domain-containing protein [Pseudomonadota bacterium]